VARSVVHWERGETERVLALYDGEFRNTTATLSKAQPDLYIDVQNAASMLFRLQRHGIDVGDRWIELADKAEARIGDCLSAFTLPHWMMALAATGPTLRRGLAHARRDWRAARNALGSRRRWSDATPCRFAGPCSRMRKGQHGRAVAAMRPALAGMYRLGGSHAQQDVLEQLFLDAAMKADRPNDARLLLERVAGRYPLPLRRRIGYAAAAHLMDG